MFRSGTSRAAPTIPSTASNRESRAAWWRRFAAATAGLLATGIGGDASPVAAAESDYRSAAAVPEAWQTFARQLQRRIEEKLAGDDERARYLQEYLSRNEKAGPRTFQLRTWIASDGKVSRVDFDGIDDAKVDTAIRALLIDSHAGVPPSEMLQPLHLRLSLRGKDRPQQRQ